MENSRFNSVPDSHWLHSLEQDLSYICVSLCSVIKQTQELQSEGLHIDEWYHIAAQTQLEKAAATQLSEQRGKAALVRWVLRFLKGQRHPAASGLLEWVWEKLGENPKTIVGGDYSVYTKLMIPGQRNQESGFPLFGLLVCTFALLVMKANRKVTGYDPESYSGKVWAKYKWWQKSGFRAEWSAQSITVASSHWSHICKQWILPIPSDSLRRSYEMTTPFLEIEVKCSLKAALWVFC